MFEKKKEPCAILKKGIKITDHIHGEASIIMKGDMDGFTIYGFEEDNLMAKNALADLDMWKQQAEEIMKTKQSRLTVAGFQFMKTKGPQTIKAWRMHLSGSANLSITRANSTDEMEANPSMMHLCISLCGPVHQLCIYIPSRGHHC